MIPHAEQISLAGELTELVVLANEDLTAGSLSHSVDTAALEEADRGLDSDCSHILDEHVNFDCRGFCQLHDEFAGAGKTTLDVALCAQKAAGNLTTNRPIPIAGIFHACPQKISLSTAAKGTHHE